MIARPSASRPAGWAVISLLSAQFMTTLDTSIVNVALPDMQRALGFTTDGLQWVVTAYLLVLGGFLMLSGRLGDVLSPLRLLRAGLAIFGSASAVGGVAGSPAVLVAARAGQGLGAAILVPTTLALITRLFTEPAERRRMLSWWSATGSFGFACGTVLGGVLVQWISWRAVLLVNVPLCAVAAIGTLRMPTARAVTGAASRRVRDVGVAGAMLVTSAATAWLFTLTWAPAHHWPSPGTAVAVGASVGLTGVLALQQRAAGRRLVTRRLLFTPGVLAANAVMFAFGIAATSGVWLVITLFLQHEAHYSPLRTGWAFLPLALIAAAAAPAVARLRRRFSTRPVLVAGLVAVTVGLGLLSRLQPSSGYVTGLLPGMVCVGAGFVLVLIITMDTAVAGTPEPQRGVASGLVNTTAQLAGALGAAVYVTLAQTAEAPNEIDTMLPFTVAAAFLAVTALLTAWRFPRPGRPTGAIAAPEQGACREPSGPPAPERARPAYRTSGLDRRSTRQCQETP